MLTKTSFAGPQPADETICALVNDQTEAWNRNSATDWAKDFVDNAKFINVRGDLVKGRTAIEKIHAFIFSGLYKESHCAVAIESIEYPAPNVAIAEMATEVTNFNGLPPGLLPTAPGVFRTRLKFILVEQEGAWKILSAQNTAIAAQPMAFT